jgi:hypothetical protein
MHKSSKQKTVLLQTSQMNLNKLPAPCILPQCLLSFLASVFSSSNLFTPCGAFGIHKKLPSFAISNYPLDLIP